MTEPVISFEEFVGLFGRRPLPHKAKMIGYKKPIHIHIYEEKSEILSCLKVTKKVIKATGLFSI